MVHPGLMWIRYNSPQRRTTSHEANFHQQILGLKSPWKVVDVKLDTAAGQVDIHVAHPDATRFCFPECGKELAL